jgi:TRAP-type C4-dicarboxylate transport system permease small subunit
MAIDLIVVRLPPAAQRMLAHANHGIIVAFLLYGIVAGTYLSWVSRARSFQGIPEVSYSWVTMSMPVGCLLLLVTTILKLRGRAAPR